MIKEKERNDMRGNNQSVLENFTLRMNQYAGGEKNQFVVSLWAKKISLWGELERSLGPSAVISHGGVGT